jgi:hypothetical protein
VTITLDQKKRDEFTQEFVKIFKSVIDTASGLHDAKIKLTEALLEQGVKINPQDLFGAADLTISRLQRLMVVKSMLPLLGLMSEVDAILSREMDLIYSGGKSRGASKPVGVYNMNQLEQPGD